MNRLTFYMLLVCLIWLASGCEKEETPFISDSDKLYIGYWKEGGYTDSTLLFTRKSQLEDDAYAFGILSDGTFLENKNTSFCGTPPITYAEYEGTWLEVSDDTLLINTTYWGGDMNYYLIIKTVTEKKLEARLEYLYFEVPD